LYERTSAGTKSADTNTVNTKITQSGALQIKKAVFMTKNFMISEKPKKKIRATRGSQEKFLHSKTTIRFDYCAILPGSHPRFSNAGF
jgi:hypothetical protein